MSKSKNFLEQRKVKILRKIRDSKEILFGNERENVKRKAWEEIAAYATNELNYPSDLKKIKQFWRQQKKLV
jgi:hypothetical protein